MEKQIAIELRNITKTFGKTIANKNVNLKVYKNEVLAILGENGSGKTTLMNIISGIYAPDEGEIFINGEKVFINSPEDAFKYKIGMIHQHFKLVDIFTAAENIILGVNESRGLKIKEVNSRVGAIADKYGFNIDVKKHVYDMSVSEKQTVEILKVLYRGADILILDEPTAVLTPQETEKLFDVLRKMRDDGKAIIIITHKLNEVMEISDEVAVLRKGEYVTTVKTGETNGNELTEMMVGKKTELKIDRPKVEKKLPLLEIRDLNVNSDDGSKAIKNVDFYIRGGEILGVAGVAGCGQKELCEAIAGLRKVQSGLIMHKGESILGLPAKTIIEKGISMSFIPEDRLGMGLAPSFSVTDNVMLKTYGESRFHIKKLEIKDTDKKFKKTSKKVLNSISGFINKLPCAFVDRATARVKAKQLVEKLEIATPSTETPVRRLSGGNVQKVLVGREIESAPNVIITAYPVRGLDVNSAYTIYDILNEQKLKGTGILFIGEDLDVMLALCDKIMVLCHGKNMGIVHADKTTKEELGLMMTGSLDLTEEKKEKNFGIAKDSNLTEEQWEKVKEEEAAENE
ncbi:MAG: ABC transporter ATP-binding protein [Candidatus Borkfalkiaceae bacterium]|nr:ABC transporter ATP-binding protein [Christensenellaceae bacterium]